MKNPTTKDIILNYLRKNKTSKGIALKELSNQFCGVKSRPKFDDSWKELVEDGLIYYDLDGIFHVSIFAETAFK